MTGFSASLDSDLFEPGVQAPARSKLFCPQPFHLGTTRVEGLVSYMVRLGRAHSVSPRLLIRREFPFADAAIGKLGYATFFARDGGAIDGMGELSEIFSKAVSGLTGTAAPYTMNLRPLRNILPVKGPAMITKHPKWCPECIGEMQCSGNEVYRPLAWSFDLYRTCKRHCRNLVDTCPFCGKRQPFIPNYPDLGKCAHCMAPLSSKSRVKVEVPSPTDLWLAAAIEDLISNLHSLGSTATLDKLRIFLAEMIAQHTGGNRAEFCRQIGLNRWALKGWLSQCERPSLPQLLSVCYGLDVMPSRIFLPEGDLASNNGILRKPTAKFSQRKDRPLLGISERKRLETQLVEFIASQNGRMPLSEVARKLGVSTSSLSYWFPEECKIIKSRHASAKKLTKEERGRRERAEVTRLVKKMLDLGENPSREKVDVIMRQQRVSLRWAEVHDAYRQAFRDVGLQ